MGDFLIGVLIGTGGIFWILVFAWAVGYFGDKLGVSK